MYGPHAQPFPKQCCLVAPLSVPQREDGSASDLSVHPCFSLFPTSNSCKRCSGTGACDVSCSWRRAFPSDASPIRAKQNCAV